jgi:hypothetical protein
MPRTATVLALGLAAMIAFGGSCQAADEVPTMSQMPFTLSVFPTVDEEHPGRLILRVLADGASEGVGRVRLSIPAGLRTESGSAAFEVPLGRVRPPETVVIGGEASGDYRVLVELQVGSLAGGGVHSVAVPLSVRGDSIAASPIETVRTEVWRGGARYRHAGLWLIPLEDNESVEVGEFERHGRKPEAQEPSHATCSSCAPSLADTVRFVVVVNRSGKVIAASVLGTPVEGAPHDPAVVESAKRAIRSKRFSPARISDRKVSDWTYADVVVRGGSRSD